MIRKGSEGVLRPILALDIFVFSARKVLFAGTQVKRSVDRTLKSTSAWRAAAVPCRCLLLFPEYKLQSLFLETSFHLLLIFVFEDDSAGEPPPFVNL